MLLEVWTESRPQVQTRARAKHRPALRVRPRHALWSYAHSGLADAHHTLQDILSHVTDTAYIPSTAYIRERVYTHPIDPNRVHARAFAVLHPQPPAQVLQHIS